MTKWVESPLGWLKLDDNGAVIERHPYKYYVVGRTAIKVKLAADGSEDEAEVHGQRSYLFVHPVSGEIAAAGGAVFSVQAELEGKDVHGAIFPDGVKAEVIEIPAHERCDGCGQVVNWPTENIVPADFFQEVEVDDINHAGAVVGKKKIRRITYKWDKTKQKLMKQ